MGCNVLANGINIFMNYLFVFGCWGLPEMGIAGAAWASVIGSWSAPIFLGLSILIGVIVILSVPFATFA